MTQVKSETPPIYHSKSDSPAGDAAIERAIEILRIRLRAPGQALSSPQDTIRFLQLLLAEEPEEVFSVLYLDNRHRVIATENLFRGTIDGASVHPRVVARRAIEVGAAAVVFAHNHPSGMAEPSNADMALTARLKESLKLFSVRVLDHIIIGCDQNLGSCSFAERGMI